MTQILLRHTSRPQYKEAILSEGLEPRNPADWNYPDLYEKQPTGVYAYEIGLDYSWGYGPTFVFPYVGPFLKDNLLSDAFVVPERVPPEALTIEE